MSITVKSLTDAQIEEIHELTIKLLSEHGIEMNYDHAVETFKAHGAKVDGHQVYIPREMVESALKSAPAEFTVHARDPQKTHILGVGRTPALCPTGGVPKINDEFGVQRPATFEDFKQLQMLTQTSPILNYASSGALFPAANDPLEQVLMMIYHTLNLTDKPLAGDSENYQVANCCMDMVKITTGYSEDRHFVVGITNSLSPMAWDKRMLEGIRALAERNQPVNITCCSMAGATSPIYLTGAILEANAEVLAGITYCQLVHPGNPVIYGTTSSVMDMGSMSLALGTPEYTLISAGCCQMAHHYGIPFRSGGGLTDAKELDAQAGMESALNLTLSVSEGVNFMLQSVGIYESFMSIGFDKWIMDEEILCRAAYLQRGLGEIPEDLCEIIADGVKAGNFLGEPSTLMNFRTETYWPHLSDRRNFEIWTSQQGNFRKLAWEQVHKRLESYVCPELTPEVKKDLQNYVAKTLGCDMPQY